MIVARHCMRYFHPQNTLCRSLRKLPNRIRDVETQGTTVAGGVNIPALQIPLTEQELLNLAGDRLSLNDVTEAKPQQKKKTPSLKEKVKPEVSPPITKPITSEDQYERLAQAVTPLYQVPYSKQLKIKERNVYEILKTLTRRLTDVQAPFQKVSGRLPCPVEPVRPSPEIIGYRNKDEFSVHFGVDSNPKTIGFFVGKPADPLMTCVPPTYLINTKESHKLIAQRFQTFIRQSHHDACHRFNTNGIWRNLLVRSTRSDERMATVYIHPQDLNNDEILEIMADLERFFFNGEGADCGLDSLYLQACRHTRCTREQAPYRLIKGKESITETCEGLSFQISPDSFFQINTGGAEELYRTVREIAEVSPLTTLLDICCGTGTVSLVMAPFVRGTVGIDVTTGAVEDAKANSVSNNVSNATFIAGRAEEVLPQLTQDLNNCTDVVAVLNPARAGLKRSVIRAIRECEAISKLVYISCKPEGRSMENFVHLASNKSKGVTRDKTTPFIPKYVVPVDMFPHTHHTELVILFERAMT